MMKKTLISIILSVLAFSASAIPVSIDKARDFALRFMGSESAEMVWEGPSRTKSTSENAVCYVFNNPSGGWVMVAGDDAAVPVIAYSMSGRFNPYRIPLGLSYWMDGVEESIRRAQRGGIKATEEIRRQWSEPRFTTKAGSGLFYETAEWGQEDPYNYYCPNVTESGRSYRSVTGCVATAMSIVMRQRQWPLNGEGTLPSYSYVSDEHKTVNIPERNISDHVYDWDSMPLKASEVRNAGTKQKQAIAQLMYDCGVMVQAEYNYSTGTGAFSSDVAPAMAAHLGYAVTATEYYRTSYDINDWIAMLKKELESNGPILYYGATAANEGHAFVFSGYDSDNRFYVNWGWDGVDNGYFSVKILGDGSDAFTEGQSAIFGLCKASEGGQEAVPVISIASTSNGGGVKLVSGSVVSKETFTLGIDSFWNDGAIDYDGAVKAALVDSKGRIKEYIGDEYRLTLSKPDEYYDIREIKSYSCTINGSIALGDRIVFYYRLPDGSWTPVLYDHEDCITGSYAVYDACFIDVRESYKAGDCFEFRMFSGNRAISSMNWYFDGQPVKDESLARRLSKGRHTVKLAISFLDGGKESITQEISAD